LRNFISSPACLALRKHNLGKQTNIQTIRLRKQVMSRLSIACMQSRKQSSVARISVELFPTYGKAKKRLCVTEARTACKQIMIRYWLWNANGLCEEANNFTNNND